MLERLGASGVDFEAVPDLCEMSARKDEALARYAGDDDVEIVACFPRAVRWLFHAAKAPLDENVRIHNMRASEPDDIVAALSPTSPGEVSG